MDLDDLTSTRFEVDRRVATVWLDRPHRHNAWTGTMHQEFRAIFAALETRDDVRAVVVTGTPPAFCVGGDSKALEGHADRGAYDSGLGEAPAQTGGRRPPRRRFRLAARLPPADHRRGERRLRRCRAGPRRVLRPAVRRRPTAKITTAAPKLGLPAEYGLSWMLPRLVGATRAADLLLSGRVVTGAETADWGLWNARAARR